MEAIETTTTTTTTTTTKTTTAAAAAAAASEATTSTTVKRNGKEENGRKLVKFSKKVDRFEYKNKIILSKDIWYTDADYFLIRSRSKKLAKKFLTGKLVENGKRTKPGGDDDEEDFDDNHYGDKKEGKVVDGNRHTFRGLEAFDSKTFEQRMTLLSDSIEAVVREQKRQKQVGIVDPDIIANIYRDVGSTVACQEYAAKVGLSDYESAKQCIANDHETNTLLTISSHCETAKILTDTKDNDNDSVASFESLEYGGDEPIPPLLAGGGISRKSRNYNSVRFNNDIEFHQYPMKSFQRKDIWYNDNDYFLIRSKNKKVAKKFQKGKLVEGGKNVSHTFRGLEMFDVEDYERRLDFIDNTIFAVLQEQRRQYETFGACDPVLLSTIYKQSGTSAAQEKAYKTGENDHQRQVECNAVVVNTEGLDSTTHHDDYESGAETDDTIDSSDSIKIKRRSSKKKIFKNAKRGFRKMWNF